MTTTITPEERAQWREKHTAVPEYYGHRIITLLNALEAAEARAEKAEAWATRLVWTVTDGRMSKLYDIEIIEEEVNTLWGERISQEVFEAEQRAEKTEAERDWLAKLVASGGFDCPGHDGECPYGNGEECCVCASTEMGSDVKCWIDWAAQEVAKQAAERRTGEVD